MTIFLFANLWTESKDSWEQVKFDAAYLSGGKVSLKHGQVKPENVVNPLSHSIEKLVRETFSHFWSYPVFLQSSGPVYLSVAKHWWTIEGGITKRCQIFLSSRKSREVALLVVLKKSGMKKARQTGVSRFFIQNFLSESNKMFRREPFCVSKCFWFQKKLCLRRSITIFCREYFVSL